MYKRAPRNKEERLEIRMALVKDYQCREVKEADCLIATKEENGRFYLMAFDGTACNPSINCYYGTEASRQRAIDSHIEGQKQAVACKERRKQQKRAAAKYTIDKSKPYFEVGAEYVSNDLYTDNPWSYTKTIRIVKRSDCFVSFVFCYENLGEEKPHRVKVSADGDGEYFTFDHGYYFFMASKKCPSEAELEAQRQAEQEEDERESAEIIALEEEEFEEIKKIISENPISESDMYYIKIEWIEGLIEVADFMENLAISVKAAEKVFSMVDENRVKWGYPGYDKWKFQILKRRESEAVWVDRYDMGDNNGGLIAFMERYKSGRSADFSEMVDTLKALTGNSVISVQLAPWVESAIEKKRAAEKENFENLLNLIEMFTDSQLAFAVLSTNYKDNVGIDIGRLFLQILAKRDTGRAFQVFQLWKAGKGTEALEELF